MELEWRSTRGVSGALSLCGAPIAIPFARVEFDVYKIPLLVPLGIPNPVHCRIEVELRSVACVAFLPIHTYNYIHWVQHS